MNSALFLCHTFLYILLLLNSFSVRCVSFNNAPENAAARLGANRTNGWSLYAGNSSDQNFSRRYHHNPFLGESSGTIADPRNRQIVNFTVVIDSPFSPNATIIIVDDPYTKIPSTTSSPPFQSRLGENYTSRSETKCKAYCDDNVVDVRPVIPLIGTASEPLPTSSAGGTRTSSTVHRLVVGGRQAVPHNYPHVVALGRQNKEKNFILLCGGTLIAPKWVLTAAHCTHGILGGVAIARLGVDRLNGNHGEMIAIKRSIRHPTYKPPALYADIALLELRKSVTFSATIKPACLHQQYHNIPISAWVCGWGATEFGGNESDTLQEARLDLVDNVECALKHNRSISVPDGVVPSMVCAGSPRNNWQQDTCHGDSGGPLQIVNASHACVHEIIGITSFGAGCAFADSPGVYTRVSHYLDWIEDNVWPESS